LWPILESSRDGVGSAKVQRYKKKKNTERNDEKGDLMDLKQFVSAAESNAMRAACDHFEVGWVDLAPFREWAGNPGIGLLGGTKNKASSLPSSPANTKVCKKCSKPLTVQDMEELKQYNIDILFCKDDIPPHMKRHGKK
jgi:hypothetical protein